MEDFTAIPEQELQRLFVSTLFHDPVTTGRFVNDVQPEYFTDDGLQYLVRFLKKHWEEYKAPPSADVVIAQMSLDIESGTLEEAKAINAAIVFDKVSRAASDPRDRGTLPWVKDNAAIWLKRQAIISASQQTLEDATNGRQVDYVKRFQNALAVGEAPITGALFALRDMDLFFEEMEERRGTSIGTGLPELDERIGGGIKAGELGVFLAATGKGKSHALVFTGRNALMAGHKVLHVTLEMDKGLVWNRYLSGMVGIPNTEIDDRRQEVREALLLRRELYQEDVVIVRYPPRYATVSTLRALLMHLKVTEDYTPDLLIVDYADLLVPMTGNKSAQKWETQEIVYEELRGLAVDSNIAVWTAAQANRGSHNSSGALDLDMSGDSYGKMRVADLVVSISSKNLNDRHEGANLERIVLPAKVRNGASNRKINVVIDASRSVFTVAPDRPEVVPYNEDDDPADAPVRAQRRPVY